MIEQIRQHMAKSVKGLSKGKRDNFGNKEQNFRRDSQEKLIQSKY